MNDSICGEGQRVSQEALASTPRTDAFIASLDKEYEACDVQENKAKIIEFARQLEREVIKYQEMAIERGQKLIEAQFKLLALEAPRKG